MPTVTSNVRVQGLSGKHMLGLSSSQFDPGCVKTCTSRECAELFSLFSSFDGDCQSGSFLIQRNRDKLSTRKFDVGVFTQPGSTTDLTALKPDFRFTPESGLNSDMAPCPSCGNNRLMHRSKINRRSP